MSRAGAPSQCHMRRKRVCAMATTGANSSAAAHVIPPSVLMSTRVIFPRPLHARPVTGHHPWLLSCMGYDGDVMIDFASMTKLNCRAVPFGSGSVYFDVSSRDIFG